MRFFFCFIILVNYFSIVTAAPLSFSKYELEDPLFFSDTPSPSYPGKLNLGFSYLQELSGDNSFIIGKISYRMLEDIFDVTGFEAGTIASFEYDVDTDLLERAPLGIYTGIHFLKFFWTQLTVQGTYYNSDSLYLNRGELAVSDESWELEVSATFRITAPIIEYKGIELGAYIQNETTIQLSREEISTFSLNRVEAGAVFRFFDLMDIQLGWRHEDIVKGSDADHFFVSLQILFPISWPEI